MNEISGVNNNKQSRKWLVTINNPIEKGFTHEKIIEVLEQFKGCVYYCMSDEIGLEEETFHTHIFCMRWWCQVLYC